MPRKHHARIMLVKARITVSLILSLFCSTGLVWAEAPQEPERIALEQRLQELDDVEQQLTDTRLALDEASDSSTRRRFRARIRELESTQADLLDALAELMGLPPPAVEQHSLNLLEEQMDARERQHEAILESDVEQRLSAP